MDKAISDVPGSILPPWGAATASAVALSRNLIEKASLPSDCAKRAKLAYLSATMVFSSRNSRKTEPMPWRIVPPRSRCRLLCFTYIRVRHHDGPWLARRQIRMARFGIRRAIVVPDLVDLVQATRGSVRGAPVRRHSEQFPPQFDGGNGNDLVCAFPVLGRSVFGHDVLDGAPRDERALVLCLDLDEQQQAVRVGGFCDGLRKQREAGRRSPVV